MTNFETGEELLKSAEEYYEEMLQAYNRGSWNIVIRHGQEVVELALKGLLKIMCMEYPREHDVSEVFERACKIKGIKIEEEDLSRIKKLSAKLAKHRAPAFYMEKLYTKEEAESIIKELEWFKEVVKHLTQIISKE
jgi:HEPN domain-containing protein